MGGIGAKTVGHASAHGNLAVVAHTRYLGAIQHAAPQIADLRIIQGELGLPAANTGAALVANRHRGAVAAAPMVLNAKGGARSAIAGCHRIRPGAQAAQ